MSKQPENILSDFQRNILQFAFQPSCSSPDDIIFIYLNDQLAYLTNKATISHYPGSVMYKSLHADMSESVTNKIVIQDAEGLYTLSAVKLLFTAITFGVSVIEQSVFDPYDTLVVPFLAHYLGVDVAQEGTKLNQDYTLYSVEAVNNIIEKLIPMATLYANCDMEESHENSIFVKVKNQLTLLLAEVAAHSTNMYHYNWASLSIDDLCTIATNIKGVKVCSYRWNSANRACERVSGIKGSDDLLNVESVHSDAVKLCVSLTWQNEEAQYHGLLIGRDIEDSMNFPKTLQTTCAARQKYTITSDMNIVIFRHGWQMRYELIMAYLLHHDSEQLPEEFQITEHTGMKLDMCLRGIVTLRYMDGATAVATLRNMLIETTAMMLRNSFICELNSALIGYLTSIDVVDIVECHSFSSNAQNSKSYVFDMLKFAITWKNTAPHSSNIDKPSMIDALAILRLIIRGMSFADSKMRGSKQSEKDRFVEWLIEYSGDDLQPQVQMIVEALAREPDPVKWDFSLGSTGKSPAADGSTWGKRQHVPTFTFGSNEPQIS